MESINENELSFVASAIFENFVFILFATNFEFSPIDIDLVGFHGQTIFHNVEEKISKQIGDGNILSQLLKKKSYL